MKMSNNDNNKPRSAKPEPGFGGVANGARTHDPQNHNLML